MKTEQDIRRFMQENKVPVSGNDAFMANLIRQIDTLPVPASLAGSDTDVQENIRKVKEIFQGQAKRRRRQALIASLISIVFCLVIFTAGYVFHISGIRNPMTITILGFVATMLTVRWTGLVRIS